MKLFGLIGNPLEHSYSQEYFNRKFQINNLSDFQYRLFQLNSITELPSLVTDHHNLLGLNITIPFKKQVLDYSDELSAEAVEANAVNCIKIDRSKTKTILKGFNTDIYGFEKSLQPLLKSWHKRALVLGSGGSSNAVTFVLKSLKIEYLIVSRNPKQSHLIQYKKINKELIRSHHLIINATPAGMSPNSGQSPDIPYEWITPEHLLFDLIYNPEETLFLKKGKAKGAAIKNGLEMLYLQAEKSWDIWQE
jgi:shikimate dehydrogenase